MRLALLIIMAALLPKPVKPNFLLVMLDDVTAHHWRQWHATSPWDGDNPANTLWNPTSGSNLYVHAPWLDAIAARGVVFQNAYANPVCGADRASLFTGQYTFRHGIGTIPRLTDDPAAFNSNPTYAQTTLNDLLGPLGYTRGIVGKYHLNAYDEMQGLDGQFDHVFTEADYDWAAITFHNLAVEPHPQGQGEGDNYNYYTRIGTPGSATTRTTQSPGSGFADHVAADWSAKVQVDDALTFMGTYGDEPWFLNLAFNLPHDPPDKPVDTSLINTAAFNVTSPAQGNSFGNYQAILEALDTQLQRLQDGIAPDVWARTYVIFTADNGGLQDVYQSARTDFSIDIGSTGDFIVDAPRLKNSPYEGGTRVPLVISGPGVAGGRDTQALFQSVDIFSTIVSLAGGAPGSVDGIDQTPVLTGASSEVRTETFCMRYSPNGDEAGVTTERDIGISLKLASGRYKLNQRQGETDTLYRLEDSSGDPVDLWEQTDLFGNPTYSTEQAAIVARVATILAS